MKYMVLLTGSGEGCDYTIGCNLNWHILSAENESDAIDEILNGILEEDSAYGIYFHDAQLIESIELLCVEKSQEIPLEPIKEKLKIARALDNEKEIRKTEIAELTRLIEKYKICAMRTPPEGGAEEGD